MALQNKQVVFAQDGVSIHIKESDVSDEETQIPGTVFLLREQDGHYLEWKAEEVMNSEWAVIGDVGDKNETDVESEFTNGNTESWKKYDISFDLRDLKSVRCHATGWEGTSVCFILKNSNTFPTLYFDACRSETLLKEIDRFVHISRSPTDPDVFLVQDHVADMLTRSFDELQLFSESSEQLVSNFFHDPYSITLESFSKVTSFLWDILMPESPKAPPSEEVAELLPDITVTDITPDPDTETNQKDDDVDVETYSEVKLPQTPQGDPLAEVQWKKVFNEDGTVTCVPEVKQIIFHGGIDPAIRKEVWKFLLDFSSWESTTEERQEERKRKINEYFCMKQQWKTITHAQEQRFSILRERKNLIAKDVARTDRTVRFYAGEDNANIQILYDILMTYCMHNFDLGYVQGMSDLLSPLLMVMENEVDAFWCFVGMMERMWHNFEMDQAGMKKQLLQIQQLMQFYDPELFSYLDSHDSGNFFFCFRWILILFKREFSFEEVPRLWEVIWTDLPCKNYHLIFALTLLERERDTLINNQFGFNEILKHINDAANTFPLPEVLRQAEKISQQLMQDSGNLPPDVREMLGLPCPPPPAPAPSLCPSPGSVRTSPNGSGEDTDLNCSEEDSVVAALNEAADAGLSNFYF